MKRVGLSAILILVALAIGYRLGKNARPDPTPQLDDSPTEASGLAVPEGSRYVRIHWYRPAADRCALEAETRNLMLPVGPSAAAHALVEARLADLFGEKAPQLDTLILDQEKVWVLALSDTEVLGALSSTCDSFLSLFAVVDTLIANFPQGDRALILNRDQNDRPLRRWGPLDPSMPLAFSDGSAVQ